MLMGMSGSIGGKIHRLSSRDWLSREIDLWESIRNFRYKCRKLKIKYKNSTLITYISRKV